MSSGAEKNPVMVAAGFKAAETRRANALARARGNGIMTNLLSGLWRH